MFRHFRPWRRTAALVALIALCNTAPTLLAQHTASDHTAAVQATAEQSEHLSPDLLMLLDERATAARAGHTGPFQTSNPGILLDTAGDRVAVQITARDVDALFPVLKSYGFELLGSAPDHHLVEGFIPIGNLLSLSQLADQGLMGILSVSPPQRASGTATSQADAIQETARVRASTPGYDGTGQCVGILSDSYDRLGGATEGVASGDLPADVSVILEGPSGGVVDEGRAMAELIHDLAPGAKIAFASAFWGQIAFGDAIRDLADPAIGNCHVLTDDIFYFDEPFFQDGVIAQAINDVVTQYDLPYLALAGNLARQSYESTAFDTALDPAYGLTHDFDPGPGVDTRQRITIPSGSTAILTLQWDDPFYTVAGVDTDLNIRLLRGDTATALASSAASNLITQTPNERFTFTNTTNTTQFDIVIQLAAGSAPGRIKYINYGANSYAPIVFNEYGTNSPTIVPHGAARLGHGVGAVHYYDQDNPASFTSAGPATILFEPDGTRLPSPEVRQKPEFAAIQGVDTTFFGSDVDGNNYPNFFGTSAAAPQAAAIAALIRQANPTHTAEQVYQQLKDTAHDTGDPGFDDRTGYGLINAYDAIFGKTQPIWSLPFEESFDSGAAGPVWETLTGGAGRIRVSEGSNPSVGGTHHVTLDSSRSGYTGLNELTLTLNLASWEGVTLSFDQREFNDAMTAMPETFSGSSDSSGVAFSVNGTDWIRLLSIPGESSTDSYQTFTFDLSQIAAQNSVTLSSAVQLKFQQYGNAMITNGGIAFDNIRIDGTFVNESPVMTDSAAVNLPPIPQDIPSENNLGTTVQNLIAAVATDRYPGTELGIAIVTADNTNGQWEYSLDGTSWTSFGTPALTNARLLGSSTRIRFVPSAGFYGTIDAGLTFYAWDGTSGSAGATADASAGGGASAFSAQGGTIGIQVIPPLYLPLVIR